MTGRCLLALTLVAAAAACGGPREDSPPAVILISLDTLAAGHLQCYGYARESSPNLCAFADESMLFLNAYAASTKTAESHMTLFTSLYPSVHKVHTVIGAEIYPLGDGIDTLAEILAGHGYKTAGFHGGGMMDEQFGFARGFESDVNSPIGRDEPVDWIRTHGPEGGFFLFLHTYRVHDPYTPKAPYDTMFDPDYDGGIVHSWAEHLALQAQGGWQMSHEAFWESVDEDDPDDVEHVVALYDGLIAQLDAELGRLIETIDRYAPDAIVVVLSDHGEEFTQHGEFLHRQTYNEVLRVPLMIRHPAIPRGVRVEHDVSLIDLAPTLLDLLALPVPDQFQGRSFIEGLRPVDPGRPVFGELPTHRLQAIIRDGRKLVVDGDSIEAYDLTTDPGETRDLYREETISPSERDALAELESELVRLIDANRTLADRYVAGDEQTLDEETLERLRQLGYIE